MFRAVSLLLLVATCFSAGLPFPALSANSGSFAVTPQARAASRFPVFFVTDRLLKHGEHGDEFSSERSTELTYGDFEPSKRHDEKNQKLDPLEIKTFTSQKQFLDRVKSTGTVRVAVFVHGYRKSFDGSLIFAEQIASQVQMPVVLFAWPSKNKYSAYMIDECTAEWSSYQLAGVLRDLGNQFGNENVDIISHSLGARIVSWSLRVLATQHELQRPFGCNLFFSPDVDRDTFVAESSFLKQSSSKVKVYLDSHDTRIWLSRVLHGSPRIGTMDNSAINDMLTGIFQFDTSMPSHHIPYPLLSAALHMPLSDVPLVHN